MTTKCLAIAKSGRRCQTAVIAGSHYCWMHAPEMAEARREAGRRGGFNRANAVRAKASLPDALTDAEVLAWLGVIFRRLIDGEVEPAIATGAATVAKAMIAVRQSSELAQRIAELERAAGISTERWTA
jgi:hypothetical protein